MKAIELHNIDYAYEVGDNVFSNLSLSINIGELVFLLGANGSGKSTLIKLLLGALKPAAGKITFNNNQVNSLSKRASHIGYVPQAIGVDPEMFIKDSLYLIGSLHGLVGSKLRNRVDGLLQDLGLDQVSSKRIKKLSGGQQQLVNIALALLHDPQVLLLDEPFVGLDFGTKSNLIAFLKSLNKTIICISHDIDLAETSADKILLLKKGKIKEYDTPENIVLEKPQYYVSIDCLSPIVEPKLSSEIKVSSKFNRMTLSCMNTESYVDEINQFISNHEDLVLGKSIYQNSLKSTLVGLYDLSFAVEQKKQKGKKNK